MLELLEISILGLASGSVYILIALAFVLVYKATNVFNFATGEMMMAGTYYFYFFDVQLGFGWLAALPMALLGAAITAVIIERLATRPLLGRPPVVLIMVTFGVSSIMRGLAQLTWGPDAREMTELLPRQPLFLGDLLIPGRLVWTAGIVAVISIGFILYYRYSRAGTAIRAASADQVTAESVGIDIRGVFRLAWIFAGVFAATAGIVTASVNGVTPQMGSIAMNVLAVVMLAGMTSVGGVVIAGLIVGWLEFVVGWYLGSSWQSFVPYLLVLVVMMVKPNGLFGEQRVERI
ncbi:branched-chain amino acid ABC transporter permease [Devosia sp. MC521]|uniref:branched-chain amino acid ABC transporter permease n=1 Tax=Devosia sp. MC521 TaxID=2759954 RepID=UPI0015F8E2CB|nr:branched-chain amino acid ABC transporter permease [Devosia sp. MC521]MBJ6989103.1 branched-chain amino acid ABC transporter permease [Devosia sp. MC521]QMW63304.1 branched-chain amino acid ABC transporter permease [Devosia sp. MC521]